MLLNREPLRAKRNVNLRISIPCKKFENVFPNYKNAGYPSGPQGHPFPRVHPPLSLISLASGVYEPTISRHQNLQYFYGDIPSLSVALVDGDYDSSTTQPPSFSTGSLPSPSHLVPFSHFIRLLYPSSSEKGLQGGSCYTQYLHETGVWVLNLVIAIQEAANTTTNGDFSTTKPGDHERINVESRALLLTEQQLLWAKDFLCLALPFNDSGDWVTDSLSSEAVHVLITAPLQQPSLGLRMQTSGRNWHGHPHADPARLQARGIPFVSTTINVCLLAMRPSQ